MKVFVVFCTLFVAAYASYAGHGLDYEHGLSYAAAAPIVAKVSPVHTGHSTQSRKQDSYGNYAFSYDEQHSTGGSSRAETGDSYGNKEGSYSLNVGDGRKRVVKYVADGAGFRASIHTNEPGIVAKAPADTTIETPHGIAVAPVVSKIIAAPAYAAPAYAAAPAYGHGYAAAPAYAIAPSYASHGHGYAPAAPAYAGYGAPAYPSHGYASHGYPSHGAYGHY